MNVQTIAEVGSITLLIFLSVGFVSIYASGGIENPMNSFLGEWIHDEKGPTDVITREDIVIYDDRVIIYIPHARISSYAPTGSMRPLLDSDANGIQIQPISETDISEGDIVSFQKDDLIIVHRVIEKGEDEEGIYFITKGDNATLKDGKIRFKDIRYKTIGVIY